MKYILIKYLAFFSFLLSLVIVSACTNRLQYLDTNKVQNPAELEKIAQRYYEFRRYDSCIKVYQELIKRYGGKIDRYEKQLAWAHYEIGFCYLLTKRYKKALIYFKAILDNYSPLAPSTLARQRIEEIRKIKTVRKVKKKRKKKT